MAPLGIVNAVELTFTAMFIALLICSLANYIYVSAKWPHKHTPGRAVYVLELLKFCGVIINLLMYLNYFLVYYTNKCSVFAFLKVENCLS